MPIATVTISSTTTDTNGPVLRARRRKLSCHTTPRTTAVSRLSAAIASGNSRSSISPKPRKKSTGTTNSSGSASTVASGARRIDCQRRLE